MDRETPDKKETFDWEPGDVRTVIDQSKCRGAVQLPERLAIDQVKYTAIPNFRSRATQAGRGP